MSGVEEMGDRDEDYDTLPFPFQGINLNREGDGHPEEMDAQLNNVILQQQLDAPLAQEAPSERMDHNVQQPVAPLVQEAPSGNPRHIVVVAGRIPIIRPTTTTIILQNYGKLSSDDGSS